MNNELTYALNSLRVLSVDMISYAKIVYQVRDPLLYHSGFPLRAARISGTDYQEINMEY